MTNLMRRIVLLLAASLACQTLIGDSKTDRFEPVGSLVGSCWRGVYENGAVDVHCYEWAVQGAFLRDRHQVTGKSGVYEGETFYGWDPEVNRLRFWYFNSLGGVSTGTAHASDGRWIFEESYESADQKLELRTVMERPDDDSYVVATESLSGAGWERRGGTRFERLDEPHTFVSSDTFVADDLLYTAKRDGNSDLWLRSPDGTTRQLTTDPAPDNAGRWSPDGSLIAFQSQRDGNYEIYLMSANGTGQRNLTNHSSFDGLPVWSPDGKRIAFFSRREVDDPTEGPFPGHIYIMNADGEQVVRITDDPLTTTWGPSDWSPDGSSLLLSRMTDRGGDIFLLDLRDGRERRLTSGTAAEAGARFSPDGKRISFYEEGDEGSHIAVMNLDGSDRRRVTSGFDRHYYPCWSSDGTWLTFSVLHESGDVDLRAVSIETGKELDIVATAEDERESSWRP